jgi:hypothetical protein
MRVIVYTNDSGVLTVVYPAQNTGSLPEDLTEEQVLQRAISKLPPEAADYVLLDKAAIPTDRTHRNAWALSSDKTTIVVDQSKISVPTAPTKEQLLAQLQVIQAQIQAL